MGGFLGGTHSVRPRGKAGRMPRHLVAPRCVAERGGLAGICLGEAGAFLYGRAEPAPPRVGCPRRDGLPEKGPGIARKAVFSEGRALRVRVARPGASRGMAWSPRS